MKTRTMFACAILLLLALAAGVVSSRHLFGLPSPPRPRTDAILLQASRPLPEFSLTLVGGVPFTRASLSGHWSLLYFGYTHCPDVCPTTLAELDRLLTQLRKPATLPPQVYFVSVDPKRDGLDLLKTYVTYFNSTFLGATGELDQLKQLTTPLEAEFSYGPAGKDGNYAVTHAAFVVLVNPQGEETAIFMPPLAAVRMAADYRAILAYYGTS